MGSYVENSIPMTVPFHVHDEKYEYKDYLLYYYLFIRYLIIDFEISFCKTKNGWFACLQRMIHFENKKYIRKKKMNDTIYVGIHFKSYRA